MVLTGSMLLAWLLSPDHFERWVELLRFKEALAYSLLYGAMAWLFYLAAEPFVRRYWPSTIISWNRLLAGRAGDPLVGRDIFVGVLFGLCYQLLNCVDRLMGSWLGLSAPRLLAGSYPREEFIGLGRASVSFLDDFKVFLLALMGILLGLAFLRALLRARWTAVATVYVVLTAWLIGELSEPPLLSLLMNGLIAAAILFCLIRFGLLSAIASAACAVLLGAFPLTTIIGAWYTPPTVYAGAAIAGLAIYGFIVSLPRGNPLASPRPPAL
jgi:serine/threonine-protein kinase